jgi:hypothetical protein
MTTVADHIAFLSDFDHRGLRQEPIISPEDLVHLRMLAGYGLAYLEEREERERQASQTFTAARPHYGEW